MAVEWTTPCMLR